MGVFLERLGVGLPVVQAGMGGGLSGHELAAAVSDAGGLGTVGFLDAEDMRAEISAARGLTGKPLAANLLLPFARARHFEAASEADIVVTFWGKPRRCTAKPWIHQCGSLEEALAAQRAGADAVIAQGVESGGHVRGHEPVLELLARVRRALPEGYPVLSAGAVAERGDVAAQLDAGAEAVVCGTRFLMSPESGAHELYKERLVEGRDTIVTELFGAGWPSTQRVLPNAATERWLANEPRGPGWLRALNRASAPMLSRLPLGLQTRVSGLQRPGLPLLGPVAATADGPATLVEAGPLYAGESVARINSIRPAGELVRELTP